MLLRYRIVRTLSVINSKPVNNCFGNEESVFFLKTINYVPLKGNNPGLASS